jgi:uncharacterized protein
VLGQLGNRVQHALRAFTPDDAKALKAAASTYPTSDFYDVEELLTPMGIGEAAVTILSEDGVPTPVVHTRLRAPASRMAPADDVEGSAKASPLFAKYGTREESESAREKLAARLEEPAPEPEAAAPAPKRKPKQRPTKKQKETATATAGGAGALGDFLTSREGKVLQKKVVRGVFGMLRKRL